MRVIITGSEHQMAMEALSFVIKQLALKATSTLGLATGSTPIKLYREIVTAYQHGVVSLKDVVTFNLDEYYQLDAEHPQSYRHFMNEHLFNHVNINKANTHLPLCLTNQDPVQCADEYEAKIARAGGIDLQILGIGSNGHIGFNEPGSSLASRTRLKTLSRKTLSDNSRLFKPNEYQPDLAMTMGVGTIMDARQILIMASGENKARAVREMALGPVTSSCPASILQMHPNVVAIIDEEAAAQLNEHTYFRHAELKAKSLK